MIAAGIVDSYSFHSSSTSSFPSLSFINFLRVNSSSISQFYGKMPWHYYITQALPLLCTTTLPFFVSGFHSAITGSNHRLFQFALLIAWTVSIYSAIPHKEWRFLHPLLPIIHILSGVYMVGPPPRDPLDPPAIQKSSVAGLLSIKRSHFLLTVITLPLSIYVIRYHGHAQIAVMNYLRTVPAGELRSVGFLMPCHSTPMQSHLHRDLGKGRLWAIGCEPPLKCAFLI